MALAPVIKDSIAEDTWILQYTCYIPWMMGLLSSYKILQLIYMSCSIGFDAIMNLHSRTSEHSLPCCHICWYIRIFYRKGICQCNRDFHTTISWWWYTLLDLWSNRVSIFSTYYNLQHWTEVYLKDKLLWNVFRHRFKRGKSTFMNMQV